ncbi:MAG: DUF302 domain-containing protein [Pseudomonadota bacterium]
MNFVTKTILASIALPSAALAGCVSVSKTTSATAPVTATEAANEMTIEPALKTTASSNDFATTLAKLQTEIDAKGLKTFAVVDHAKGAASIGEPLRPTTLIIFGNPKGGTPLIQARQEMGLALPLKALVFEDEAGTVQIATTDIQEVASRYGVSGNDQRLANIAGLLDLLATTAAN